MGENGLRPLGAPLCPSHHHIDLAAAAFRADQPIPPLGNGHFGAVALSLFGGIGLDLMAVISAPHDQTNAGSGRAARRSRPTRLGFQRLRAAVARGGGGNGWRAGSGRIFARIAFSV
jgi:hypothetical protein